MNLRPDKPLEQMSHIELKQLYYSLCEELYMIEYPNDDCNDRDWTRNDCFVDYYTFATFKTLIEALIWQVENYDEYMEQGRQLINSPEYRKEVEEALRISDESKLYP